MLIFLLTVLAPEWLTRAHSFTYNQFLMFAWLRRNFSATWNLLSCLLIVLSARGKMDREIVNIYDFYPRQGEELTLWLFPVSTLIAFQSHTTTQSSQMTINVLFTNCKTFSLHRDFDIKRFIDDRLCVSRVFGTILIDRWNVIGFSFRPR